MRDPEQEIATAIACEHAAGAVRAMGSRGESEDEKPGVRVAETRDGFAPVCLIFVGPAFCNCDRSAVVDEARTGGAVNDIAMQDLNRAHIVMVSPGSFSRFIQEVGHRTRFRAARLQRTVQQFEHDRFRPS